MLSHHMKLSDFDFHQTWQKAESFTGPGPVLEPGSAQPAQRWNPDMTCDHVKHAATHILNHEATFNLHLSAVTHSLNISS